ncbi:lysine-ketoglutarate reductase/saccharopine dehydrogenase-like protein (TIGR00300 family) [Methanomicrobium sp. W14]|uniref:ornithine cyclodeaminase n=1 Tax=Methanomicrobium sp. W14 TaxID=2817839 RepID=UPI001AE92C8D|nr:TIGR00300 family protein [Methanomicrobium sp. W14]MBP2132290.1 lysine-ketoglutarate reductase/saccharopine dehydrogenase-like protein (TIGR00300 family) [Methanomicrobium sp. W14]
MEASREIELQGHIIDSGIMTRVFDKVLDMGGNFEITTFDIGKRKQDPSYARLIISSETEDKLENILSELHRLGARMPEMEDIRLEEAEGDKILPKGFYSTTNHPTFVKYNGNWISVENIEMDCHIVIEKKTPRALCTPLAKIKKGDLIVIGERGVRIVPPERSRKVNQFEFMQNTVSSERPSETIIKKIAGEMKEIKERGGKIGIVGGPAIVHTRAAPALAKIIRAGYIDALFAGNALATHDIEYNLFGTSLGMNLDTGTLAVGGHKNHITTISEVIRAGSIRKAVECGLIKKGIMYECIKNNVPFVLAGSIRDDGPLPDVITDVMVAQEEMRKHLRGLDMVIMIGTLLHSIAIGNCLPSYVKTICVDINPASVTKLSDRGSAQAIGVVSDAGAFLPLLAKYLIDDEKDNNKKN